MHVVVGHYVSFCNILVILAYMFYTSDMPIYIYVPREFFCYAMKLYLKAVIFHLSRAWGEIP